MPTAVDMGQLSLSSTVACCVKKIPQAKGMVRRNKSFWKHENCCDFEPVTPKLLRVFFAFAKIEKEFSFQNRWTFSQSVNIKIHKQFSCFEPKKQRGICQSWDFRGQNVPRMEEEENIIQVPEKTGGRKTPNIFHDLNWNESRGLGALSNMGNFHLSS